MVLQFRRGTAADRLTASEIPEIGEPWFTYDNGRLYVGDGATPGGVEVGANLSLESLNNVEVISEFAGQISSYLISSNVAGITLAEDHNYYEGLSIVIAGSGAVVLNGVHTITSITGGNTFTFDLTASDITTTAATGTVTPVVANSRALIWDSASGTWIDGVPSITVGQIANVTITSLSDGQSLIYDDATSSWINSTPATELGSLTDVSISSATDGQFLSYDETSSSWQNTTLSVSGLSTRTTVSGTTPSIADYASANIAITGFKSYMLMAVEVDAACWVTIYTSSAARSADASRLSYQDPLPGSGVIAEVITASATTQKITPSLLGFNDEATPTDDIYLKVENQSGASAAITVTLTLLRLEA